MTISGLPAAVTTGKGTDWRFRLAAIQAGQRVYRFILAAKGGTDPERGMRAVLDSFRSLSPSEAQSVKPMQIRLVAAAEGDTPASLSGRMATHDRPLELFQILNGLDRSGRLTPGQRYKIVTE